MARRSRRRVLGELFRFLLTERRTWLIPLVVLLLVLTIVAVVLETPAVAPLLYPLF